MKLWELVEEFYLAVGNAPAEVTIETDALALKYGHVYEGKQIMFRGVNGRLGDIPAYLANCDVKSYDVGSTFRFRI